MSCTDNQILYSDPAQRVNLGASYTNTANFLCMAKTKPTFPSNSGSKLFISSFNSIDRVSYLHRQAQFGNWFWANDVIPSISVTNFGKSITCNSDGTVLAVASDNNVFLYTYINPPTDSFTQTQNISQAETILAIHMNQVGTRLAIGTTSGLAFRVRMYSVSGGIATIMTSINVGNFCTLANAIPTGGSNIRNLALFCTDSGTECFACPVKYNTNSGFYRVRTSAGIWQDASPISFASLGLDTTNQANTASNQVTLDGDVNGLKLFLGYAPNNGGIGIVKVLSRASTGVDPTVLQTITDTCNISSALDRFGMGLACDVGANKLVVTAPNRGSNKGGFYRYAFNGSSYVSTPGGIHYEDFYVAPNKQGDNGSIGYSGDLEQTAIGAHLESGGQGNTYIFDLYPILFTSPPSYTKSVNYGNNATSDNLAIANIGGNILNYTLSSDVPWATPLSTGSVFRGPINDTINYTTSSLNPGVYNGNITVSGTNVEPPFVPFNIIVPITLTVNGPVINVNPSSFSHTILQGGSISNDTFNITNTGVGTLNWSATPNVAWLTTVPTSGTAPSLVDIVYGGVPGLGTGTHNATITIACTNVPSIPTQVVNITVQVDPVPPIITLSTTSFNHTILEGGSIPNDIFTITNTGGSTLQFAVSDDQTWLSQSPTSGTAPQNVNVIYGGVGLLTPGTYMSTITVSCTNFIGVADKFITVIVQVDPVPPIIDASPNVFNHTIFEGDSLPNDIFSVANIGGSTLQFSVSDNQSWLSQSPTSGTAPQNVNIIYGGVNLLTPGSYTATITISCTNFIGVADDTVVVNLTVDPVPPIIEATPDTFSHGIIVGNTLPNDQFNITNIGGSTLDWSATPDVAWLSTVPTSGTAPSLVDIVYGGVNLLPVGTHVANITISCTNFVGVADKIVTVTINVAPAPPIITLSATSFNHTILEGGSIPNDVFTVTNTGGGTLQFAVSDDQPWLSQSPTSGTAPQNVNVIYGGVGLLTPGTYMSTITISCTNFVGVADKFITVIVQVDPVPPIIDASPNTFNHTIFEGDSLPNDIFSVVNVGGSTLQFSVSDNQSWLSESPTSGTAPQNVNIIYGGVNLLTPGSYSATITISCTNFVGVADDTVIVNLTVNPVPPIIDATPDTFSHTIIAGNSLPNDQFNITNIGGSTLDWSATPDVLWLTVSPTSGTAPNLVDIIYGGVPGLGVGTHVANITISCTNFVGVADKIVTVTITVNPVPPIITLSATSFNHTILEGGSIPNDTFTITNTGGSTLQFAVTDDQTWLSQSPTSGTAPQLINIIYGGVGALSVGTYMSTITVSCTNFVGVADKFVTIIVQIDPVPPIIDASPNTFNHTIFEGDTLPNDMFTVSNIGGSTLNFSVSDNQPWLSQSPTSGTAPQNVNIIYGGVNTLTPGSYSATITISCTNFVGVADDIVIVNLTVNPVPPIIDTSPSSFSHGIQIGNSLPNDQFNITNIGGSTLDWLATPDVVWLSTSPISSTAPSLVDIIYGGVNLLPLGTHVANITISCTNFVGVADKIVTVTIIVTPIPPVPPIITVVPTSFSHTITQGGSLLDDTFTVQNTGGSGLDYQITESTSWLSVNPTTGTSITLPNTHNIIYGGVNTLTPGNYTSIITISCTNFVGVSDGTITVTLVVLAPPSPPTPPTPSTPSSSNNWVWWLIVILVALFLFFLLARRRRRR